MDDKNMSHIVSKTQVLNISSATFLHAEFSKSVGISDSNDIGQSIIKRSSRVLEALYIVSHSIPVSDKLREDIRSRSFDVFSSTLTFLRSRVQNDLEEILDGLIRVDALVHAARASGYVTVQRANLVSDGLTNFYTKLSSLVGSNYPEDLLKDIVIGQTSGHSGLGGVVDNTFAHDFKSHKSSISELDIVKDRSHVTIKGGGKKALNRKDFILQLVKDKSRVTVKDIQSVIKGFSQKTLQRELLSLVASGVLKKEGERRWSVYSLKTNGISVPNGNHAPTI